MIRTTRLFGGLLVAVCAAAALSSGCSSSTGGGSGGNGGNGSTTSGSTTSGASTGTGPVICVTAAECTADTHHCKMPACEAGACDWIPAPPGSKCSDEEGVQSPCDDRGYCVDCLVASDCFKYGPTSVCQQKKCVPPTCLDGIKNGAESDVDCGGDCAPCAAGAACIGANDCSSHLCSNLVCLAASCADLTLNGTETDVDCGGDCAAKCASGKRCGHSTDCASHVCGPYSSCQ